jgi:hypothetical protein
VPRIVAQPVAKKKPKKKNVKCRKRHRKGKARCVTSHKHHKRASKRYGRG